MPAVVVWQQKSWRRADGIFIYCEIMLESLLIPKVKMKGSGVSSPLTKSADLWLRVAAYARAIV